MDAESKRRASWAQHPLTAEHTPHTSCAKSKAQTLAGTENFNVCKVIECKQNHYNLEQVRYDAKTLTNNSYNEIAQNEICIDAYIIVEFCA